MARGDAALASWRDLPALAATWWLALSAERSGGSSLLAIAAMAVALLAGAGGERAVARLLARLRRRCSGATPKRFSPRAGLRLAWGGLGVPAGEGAGGERVGP